MEFLRDIKSVKSTLENAKANGLKVNLLIGAGCSKSAGIPLAAEIVREIKSNFRFEHNVHNINDYAKCMSLLTPIERRALIYDYVKNAKINWAHIGMAQLLKFGYINRIFTTNFDNLVTRACSLVGEYPGVYDLAFANQNAFRSDLLYDKSIIHLHGQHTGFVLCNTEDEVQNQASAIEPIFDELNRNSVWIIAGYSGANDAIFNLLSKCDVYENRLFWVGFKNNDPDEHVASNILTKGKYGFYIKGYDADSFFTTLSRELNAFPPIFIDKPFTYLEERLDELKDFKVPRQFGALTKGQVKESTNSILHYAVNSIENDIDIMLNHYICVGKYDKFIDLVRTVKQNYPNESVGRILYKCKDNLYRSILDLHTDYESHKLKLENGNGLIDDYYDIADILDSLAGILSSPLPDMPCIYGFGVDDVTHLKLYWLIEAYMLFGEDAKLLRRLIDVSFKACCASKEQHNTELLFDYFYEFSKSYLDDPRNKDVYIDWFIRLYRRKYRVAGVAKKLDKHGLFVEWINEIDKLITSSDMFKDRYLTHLEAKVQIMWIGVKYEHDNCKSINLKDVIDDHLEIESDKVLGSGIEHIALLQSLFAFCKAENYKSLECINEINSIYQRGAYSEEKLGLVWIKFINNNIKIFSEHGLEAEKLIHDITIRMIEEFGTLEEATLSIWYKHSYNKSRLDDMLKAVNNAIINDTIEDRDKFVSEINQFAFGTISGGSFDGIDKILDLTISYSKYEYLVATLGLWYFNNPDVDKGTAESNGRSLYENAISIACFVKNNSDAFKQKYYFELAKFKERHDDQDSALHYAILSCACGENSQFRYLFKEVTAYYNKVKEKHNVTQLVTVKDDTPM